MFAPRCVHDVADRVRRHSAPSGRRTRTRLRPRHPRPGCCVGCRSPRLIRAAHTRVGSRLASMCSLHNLNLATRAGAEVSDQPQYFAGLYPSALWLPFPLTCTDASWPVSSTGASAGSDDRLRFLFRRVAGAGRRWRLRAVRRGRPQVPRVVVGSRSPAGVFVRSRPRVCCRNEASDARCRSGRRCSAGRWMPAGTESFDLGAQVGLVVEPGPGDLPFARHRVE